MARSKGTFNFSANFEVLAKAPLDAKMLVQNYTDLVNPTTWEDLNSNVWLFNGAIVSVATDPSSGLYFLKDADNYTDYASWEPVGSGIIPDSSLNFLNIGYGTGIFAEFDSSGNILLRTIDGSNGVITYLDGSTLIIEIEDGIFLKEASLGDSFSYDASGFLQVDVSVDPIYSTTLDPSLEMPNPVGGYPAGTTVADLYGDSLIQMWDNLLFPTVNPTYVNPTNSWSKSPTGTLYESGSSQNFTFTSTLNKGAINIGSNFQDFRSGDSSLYNYTDPSGNTLLVDTQTSALSDVQSINGYEVSTGYQSFTSTVSYLEGPQPLDNKGNPYDSPLSAGTLGTQTITIEGVYPLFATTADITTYTQRPLVSMKTGNNIVFPMVPETGGNKQKFSIPDPWTGAPTSRALTGIQTYNTVSNTWEYQGGSAANSLTFWNTSGTNRTIQGNSIPYTNYTYNGTDRSSIDVRLVFAP